VNESQEPHQKDENVEILLNDVEIRVLGSLVEKELTTPDYYPLTLNALTNACNQKSNRNPVLVLDETTVVRGLDGLLSKGMATRIHKADSRTPKYQHTLYEKMDLTRAEISILCELMLRGPQTVGELRSRAGRMSQFDSLEETETVLTGLIEREQALVMKLPRMAGRKERRYMHLLAGKPQMDEAVSALKPEAATVQVQAENERISKLEEELTSLRREVETLKRNFMDFRSQFEE